MNFDHNSDLKKDLENFVHEANNLGLDIWTSFIKYWSLRKAYPFIPTFWFDLIESDQEFRLVFSEEVAEELIKVIEDGRLTKEIVHLIK